MLKGVIFDMDGVLVNSEPIHYRSYCVILEQLGVKESYDYRDYLPYVGSTRRKLVEDFKERFHLEMTVEEIDRWAQKLQTSMTREEGYPAVPGVLDLVKSLHAAGRKLAVASSSTHEDIVECVKGLGAMDYFDQLVSAASLGKPKPEPDVFLKTLEELGLTAEECVVIEDSENGILAAKRAGIACIGFLNPDSGNQDLSGADILVEGFEEVDDEFVERVWKRAHGEP